MKLLSKYRLPLLMLLIFETIATVLWISLNDIFFLANFSYIGIILSFGLFLSKREYKYSRLFTQFGVGLYMFLFLGIMSKENMQLEGFWYYLFLGVFQAAVIHYLVAKIAGPLLFGRGWCGYACWTAMVLDFLPYKVPQIPRKEKLGIIKYVLFIFSLSFVGALFLLKVKNIAQVMFASFIIGNILYYAAGIALAFIFKDNRAFCKYICPITVFLKPASYFSLLRVKIDQNKCIACGRCKKSCPMNVDMLNNKRSRQNGTECILCLECVKKCPKKALNI